MPVTIPTQGDNHEMVLRGISFGVVVITCLVKVTSLAHKRTSPWQIAAPDCVFYCLVRRCLVWILLAILYRVMEIVASSIIAAVFIEAAFTPGIVTTRFGFVPGELPSRFSRLALGACSV
jgi:hypothetical protein